MTVEERETIREISAYEPVEREGLNLSDNANLFEPNPAIQRGLDAIEPDDVRGYPSGYADELRATIGDVHDVDPSRVVTANGSSDLIDLLVRSFTDPGDRVAYHPPSFSMIPLWSRCNAATPHPIPLGEDFDLDTDAFTSADASVGVICRPNNPTGNAFPLEQVETVAERFEGLLIVDEAYIRFTERPDAVHLADREDVAVLRSLSKDAGLAGTRFGYAVTAAPIVDTVRKVRGPFRVPRTTEAIATAALEAPGHAETVAKTVRKERERVRERVDELGLSPFPTETNFLLIETAWPSSTFAEALAEKGVLVRDFSTDTLEACVRVTIGPPDANDRFLEALEAVLDEGGP